MHSLGVVRYGTAFGRLFGEWIISNAFELCDVIALQEAIRTNSLQLNLDLSEVCQFVYERLIGATVRYSCVSTFEKVPVDGNILVVCSAKTKLLSVVWPCCCSSTPSNVDLTGRTLV